MIVFGFEKLLIVLDLPIWLKDIGLVNLNQILVIRTFGGLLALLALQLGGLNLCKIKLN